MHAMSDNGHSAAFYKVLGLLDGVKRAGSGYVARCPAHEDRAPSLSVGVGYDGRVLLNCHAGCQTEAVCRALGLELGDLFERDRQGNVVRRFRSLDANGQEVATHVRIDRPNGKAVHWERNGKRNLDGVRLEDLPLYRLPDLLAAPKGATVYVCEGEADTDALAERGLLAVGTMTGAAGTPSAAVLAPLRDYDVVLWADADEPGQQHMARVAARLAGQD